MHEEEKKTSSQWYDELGKHYMILSPDGWDRRNYDYSFNKELITKEEYNHRVMESTLLHEQQFGTWTAQ